MIVTNEQCGVLIIVTAGHMRQYEARELGIIQMMMSCVGTQTWTWWTVMESVVSTSNVSSFE